VTKRKFFIGAVVLSEGLKTRIEHCAGWSDSEEEILGHTVKSLQERYSGMPIVSSKMYDITDFVLPSLEESYRQGFRDGFVEAKVNDVDGPPDETTALVELSDVSVSEGWDAYRDAAI
jgi:hypothetical protein